MEDLFHELQLQSEVSNPNNPQASIVIVDCRFSLMQPHLGRQQYETSHLPGAYYLDLNQDLSSPVATHGGRHPLPNPDVLAVQLTAMGITPETLVVAYDDSRLAFAARLWWLLRYLGHDRVAVLNGGWSAWQAAGLPTTTEIPPPRPGAFVPCPNPQEIVDIQDIRAGLQPIESRHQSQPDPGAPIVLIDSRESVRYRGESEPIDPIAGHIPGAVNYPWQEVTDENGFVQSLETQRDRWKSLSANQPSPEIIAYCGSGVTACVNLLSLYQVGIPAKLYPGSWSDWCSYLV
ncbi:MAG: sulfurtransferase [Alkalinema sp. CACIAM 70d]|nr:MAG: sulfurtransferase [Alkalinema sp. CACIAM 70d]